MDIQALLKDMVDREAADIFVISGRPIGYKSHHKIENYTGERLLPAQTEKLVLAMYAMAGRDPEILKERGDDDFSFAVRGVSRFRVNAYKQRGSLAMVIRVVPFSLPDPTTLRIPAGVLDLADKQRGLVLVTGSSGSGKTTTLTCILEEINERRDAHIVTLEDPIEYLHAHKKSIFSQREISLDTESYPVALRSALRQSPDVILIGELRDPESIGIALTAAETGHLVFSSLHTLGAANTIDRLVDTFPAGQQSQVRMQLSMALQTVVCQQLVPSTKGGVVPVFEIMHCNSAIRTLIRDGRTHQINSIIQASSSEGMVGMDMSLANLVNEGLVDKNDAVAYSLSPELLERRLGMKKK